MQQAPLITNISRGSFHDGPGIRTVVYFKSCTLNCKWCHNPETINKANEVLYVKSKCIHCGKCIELCPDHHKIIGNDMVFLREGCTNCGKCADNCPSGALVQAASYLNSENIMKEIMKDRFYFNESGGGVTFSGGECLLYPDFLSDILKECKKEKVHTAIESAFFVPWKNIESVYPYIDLVFADLKIPQSEKHKEYTGQRNDKIIENIRKLSFLHQNIIIRIPLIPKVNDSKEDMKEFAKIINSFSKGVKAVELLKYNYLAESKYENLGKEFVRYSDTTQSDAYVNMLARELKSNLREEITIITQ